MGQLLHPYEAREAARLCNGHFKSVNSKPRNYCCTTDGCETVSKVQHNKRQGQYTIVMVMVIVVVIVIVMVGNRLVIGR